MDTDWFGFALILGIIAIGTPVLFFLYKTGTFFWRRAFGSSDGQPPEHANVTPHALLAIAILLIVVLIIPVFYLVSFPNRERGSIFLALWVGTFAALVFAERRLLANPNYRNSWWCRPLGANKEDSP